MKKRIFALLLAVCMSFSLTGCYLVSEKSDEATLAAVPYSFSGESGDFAVTYEVRRMTEEDIKTLSEEYQALVTTENGYRSAVRITYKGSDAFQSLSYTFAKGMKWEYANAFPVNEGDEKAFTALLDGTNELSGKVCTADGSVGGALPTPTLEHTFTLVVRALGKDAETIEMTLTPDQA